MGSPVIVTVWLFVSVGLFAMFGKHILTLLKATGDGPGAQPHEMGVRAEPGYGTLRG